MRLTIPFTLRSREEASRSGRPSPGDAMKSHRHLDRLPEQQRRYASILRSHCCSGLLSDR
jgi:hypothetical protein